MKNLSRKEALRKGEKMDTVSRQAAIDALCKSECGCNNAECGHRDNTDFCVTCDNVKIIKSLPSAQPERKKGKWIYNSPVTMKCDQCGLVIKDWDWHRFKYCPNCGADMRGEQE